MNRLTVVLLFAAGVLAVPGEVRGDFIFGSGSVSLGSGTAGTLLQSEYPLFIFTPTNQVGDFVATATLLPQNEVPPKDTPAFGTASAAFNSTTERLTVNVTFTNLSGPAVDAHIHFGDAGVNGPVIFPFSSPPFPYAKSGSYTTVLWAGDLVPSPANGINTFADAINAILGGHTYVRIHDTTFYPGGEIRGQLVVPEPSIVIGLLSMGLAGLGVAWCRRKRLRLRQ